MREKTTPDIPDIPDMSEVWASIDRLRQEVALYRSRLEEAADKLAVLEIAAFPAEYKSAGQPSDSDASPQASIPNISPPTAR